MVAHVNRTAALAVTLGLLLSVPATVDALPIHFRPTTESTLDVRDDANSVQDAAGAVESAGLLSSNGNVGQAGSGGGGVGGAAGGAQASGGSGVRSGSTKRGTSRPWIRGSEGSGFRAGSVWNDPGLLLIATLPTVIETNSATPTVNGKIPEPATAILFGSAVAFLSVRRLRRRT